jgi:hypothetical protein
MKIKEFNAETGEEIIRDYTKEELAQAQKDFEDDKIRVAAQTAKETEKAALLAKLGITADEAKLLLS